MDISRWIRERRTAAGLTQAQLAEKTGVTQSIVFQWERGVTEPSSIALAKLRNILEGYIESDSVEPSETLAGHSHSDRGKGRIKETNAEISDERRETANPPRGARASSGRRAPLLPNRPESLTIKRNGGKIWSHIRKRWLEETPEESVRQNYLCVLVNEYGFSLDQIGEELEVTGRGSGGARADFVIWPTIKDKSDSKTPLIIVECKSDNVMIKSHDYAQGDNYSRLTGARFFVTHNSRETKFWRVVHERMPKSFEEISNIPHANATDKEIEELISKLKVFKEDEFADLLHKCHNVIRNREKLDPAAAFDEIAKILFVKVYVERELRTRRQRENLFTVEFLDRQIGKHPLNTLFEQTKEAYEGD